MNGNPFVGTARIGWNEFRSHLRSPRLIILVVLLALLVFGVSYGLSQSSPIGGLGTAPTLAVHAAIRNESGTDHYLVIGWLADSRGVPRPGQTVSVYRQDLSGSFANPYGTPVGNVTTDATGFAEYDTGTTFDLNVSYALRYGEHSFCSASFYFVGTNVTFTTANVMSGGYSGPSGSASYFSMHVMTLDGYPATPANVTVDGNASGHPDGNGFYLTPITEGTHNVEVSYKGTPSSTWPWGATTEAPCTRTGPTRSS